MRARKAAALFASLLDDSMTGLSNKTEMMSNEVLTTTLYQIVRCYNIRHPDNTSLTRIALKEGCALMKEEIVVGSFSQYTQNGGWKVPSLSSLNFPMRESKTSQEFWECRTLQWNDWTRREFKLKLC
ncbi:unnamed protein product [Caenorhabditis brenneri]